MTSTIYGMLVISFLAKNDTKREKNNEISADVVSGVVHLPNSELMNKKNKGSSPPLRPERYRTTATYFRENNSMYI